MKKMKDIDIHYRPEIRPDFLFEKLEESKYVLLHPENPGWVIINDIGLEIINQFDGSLSIGEITLLLSSKYCINGSIIYNDIINYLKKLELAKFLSNFKPAEEKKKSKPILKNINFYLTNGCNLKCRHCGATELSPETSILNKDIVCSIVDELSSVDNSSIGISGGEALLNKDCLNIIKYASGKVNITLATNGTLVDDQLSVELSNLDLNIQISLDGGTAGIHDEMRGTGSFEKTINGIKFLKKHGLGEKLLICTVLTKKNVPDIKNILALVEEMEIPIIRFIILQKMGRADLNWSDLSLSCQEQVNLYKYLLGDVHDDFKGVKINSGLQGFTIDVPETGLWCPIGKNLSIDHDGSMYPCSLMMSPDFFLGNIKNMNVEDAAESEKMMQIMDQIITRRNKIEKCVCCVWKNLCQGGCMASTILEKGESMVTDELCEMRKQFYKETMISIARKGVSKIKFLECKLI